MFVCFTFASSVINLTYSKQLILLYYNAKHWWTLVELGFYKVCKKELADLTENNKKNLHPSRDNVIKHFTTVIYVRV